MSAIGGNIVAKARSHVGEIEAPLGSNAGPEVDGYLAYVGLEPGEPWCAAFACFVVGAVLEEMRLNNARPRTGSSGGIVAWGKAQGKIVSADAIKPGDLGEVIDADSPTGYRHTVIAATQINDNLWATIEGNFADSVAEHQRDVGNCVWVRPY